MYVCMIIDVPYSFLMESNNQNSNNTSSSSSNNDSPFLYSTNNTIPSGLLTDTSSKRYQFRTV